MRRSLLPVVLFSLLAGCTTAGLPPAPSHVAAPQAGGASAAFPFQLLTHCGILRTVVQGRVFYLTELSPARITARFDEPVTDGVMTLVTPDLAEFRTHYGDLIDFTDQLPGEIERPYPFQVHVLSGGNTLIDEQFAGRIWHPLDTIPGVTGPPYGNGRDASAPVDGTFTIQTDDHALFRSRSGALVRFVAVPPGGCD